MPDHVKMMDSVWTVSASVGVDSREATAKLKVSILDGVVPMV